MSTRDTRWYALAVLALAQFMLILDVTVVNVALPAIAAELDMSAAALPWVVSAYALTFGGLLILGGRLADRFGPTKMIFTGLTVFTLASAAAGLSETTGTLLAARAVQGLGAALLSPAALSLVSTMFEGRDRHRALGVWAALGAVGVAVGVLVGGLLTGGPGWSWAFLINVPVGVVVAAGLARWRPQLSEMAPHRTTGRPDVLGALAITATVGLFVYGLIQSGSYGWSAPETWAPLGVAVLAAPVAVMVERRAVAPVVPPQVIARRGVVAGLTVMLSASGLLVAAFFLASLYLQAETGLSATSTGLAFLPAALATIVGAHTGARFVGLAGWRPVARGAFIISAIGLIVAGIGSGADAGTAVVAIGLMIAAGGVAATFVAATTSALATVDHHESGVVSGIVNTGHELGAALGVAVVSAIATAASAGIEAIDATGYRVGFLAAAGLALVAAGVGSVLLPAGRPDVSQAPMPIH